MAKSKEKLKAIKLRKKGGKSIKQIAQKLGVSKSTASLWCRDIILTPAQIQKLHDRMVALSYAGRMKGARFQYDRRIKKIAYENKEGIKTIGKLSERELLIATAALYWGEGCKKTRQLIINNSDPEMIKFIINAFKKIWKIEKGRFTLRVGINIDHKKRDEEVKNYWSKITKIPKEQFTKTVFIKAKNKKVYKNFSFHYGTLTIRVKKGGDIYYRMMGLINGLSKSI